MIAELEQRARRAAERAYAPASGFRVGAAVLADDGRMFAGCNVENASYGLTVCAERTAVFRAVAEGARRLAAVAVYTPLSKPAAPCGACRQVLAEFGPSMAVILCGDGPETVRTSLDLLLPDPFLFDATGHRAEDRR